MLRRYLEVRARTEALAAPLSEEDQQLQSMPGASPAKWHRAHTTWFFETFLLGPRGVAPVDPRWAQLFNSYYQALGPSQLRAERGLLSRPSARAITDYRRAVDGRVAELIPTLDAAGQAVVELGLAHEEQHQELLLTDVLHAFSRNPLLPAYRGPAPAPAAAAPAPLRYQPFPGGLCEIGAVAGSGFAFDNEAPRHKVWLEPFALASRLVCVAELKAFIAAGGYRTPSLWLAEGWDWVQSNAVRAPLYARTDGGALLAFGLDGERVCGDAEPASHLSYYEADALARFLGARLPGEAEWEVAAGARPVAGHFLDDGALRPQPSQELYGDCWVWTRSSYAAYPGYQVPAGPIGEYNGKFMVGQQVLRGGSCFTPREHMRATYRNYWPAATQFQMTGVRLARDGDGVE